MILPKKYMMNNLPENYRQIVDRSKNTTDLLTKAITKRITKLHTHLSAITNCTNPSQLTRLLKQYRLDNKNTLKANYVAVDVYSTSRSADQDVIDNLLYTINHDYKVRHKTYVKTLNEMIGNPSYTLEEVSAFVEASGISSHPKLRDALKAREDSEPLTWTDVQNILDINLPSSPMLRA